jgi:hypothetical protein
MRRIRVKCLGPLTWIKWHRTPTLPISFTTSRVLVFSSFVWCKRSEANVDRGFSTTERIHPEQNRLLRNENNGTVTLSTCWYCRKISMMVLQRRSSSTVLPCRTLKYENRDAHDCCACGQTFKKGQIRKYYWNNSKSELCQPCVFMH